MHSLNIKKASIDDVEEILQMQKRAKLIFIKIIKLNLIQTLRGYKTRFLKTDISESSY